MAMRLEWQDQVWGPWNKTASLWNFYLKFRQATPAFVHAVFMAFGCASHLALLTKVIRARPCARGDV